MLLRIKADGVKDLSHAQVRYLKARAWRETYIRLLQFGLLFFLLALWELAARMRWIDPFLLSSPSRMIRSAGR